MDFATRAALLESLGIRFGRAYEYRTDKNTNKRDRHDVDLFTNILLPFNPNEWCSIAMNAGDHYIGGCCGNLSVLQDEISGIFREGGWVSCRDLEKIAEIATNHYPISNICFDKMAIQGEEEKSLDDFVAMMKGVWSSFSPWDKIACIWHMVKDYFGPAIPHGYGRHMSELEKSISVLSRSLTYLSFERVFRPKDENSICAPEDQEKANRAILLARVLPALKTLNEEIDQLDLGSIEGYALIDKEVGPEEVAKNGFGYCIFATENEAKKLFRQWKRESNAYQDEGRNYRNLSKPLEERIGIRKVRVSKENGIEFLFEV